MKKNKVKIILLSIFIAALLILRFPVRFAAAEDARAQGENEYIVEYCSFTDGFYIARKEDNPFLDESIVFYELTGNTPFDKLNMHIFDTAEDWENGEPPAENKFIFTGNVYDVKFSDDITFKGIKIDKWDFVGSVNRSDLLAAVALPPQYLTIIDFLRY